MHRRLRKLVFGSLLVAGLGPASGAGASAIPSGEVNANYGTATAYTAGAAADPALNSPRTWNALATNGTTTISVTGSGGTTNGLKDSAGNFTGIGLTVQSTGASNISSFANNNAAGTANGPVNPTGLMGHYFFGTSYTATLTSVPAGNYNLYLYGAGNATNQGAGFTIAAANATITGTEQASTTGASADITTTPNGGGPGTTNNNDYVILPVTVPDGGSGTGTLSWTTFTPTGSNGSETNGFQLVAATPEPASLGLPGLAAVGLLARRRRA